MAYGFHEDRSKAPVYTKTEIDANYDRVCETIAAMQADTNLTAGMIVHTLGFHSAGDGGGAWYKITDTGTANGMDILNLGNNLYAKLIIDKFVSLKQLGAYGDSTHDDTDVTRYALNFVYANHVPLFVTNGKYLITDDITIDDQPGIYMKGFEEPCYMGDNNDSNKCRFVINVQDATDIHSVFKFVRCEGLHLESIGFENINQSDRNYAQLVYAGTSGNSTITRCMFKNGYIGLYLDTSGVCIVSENEVTSCRKHGIHGIYAGDSIFSNNYINTNEPDAGTHEYGIGLFLQYCGNSIVDGGKIEWNSVGILIDSTVGLTISNVQFDVNRVNHIRYYSDTWYGVITKSTVITNCRFLAGGTLGDDKNSIKFTGNLGGNKFKISNNTFVYAGDSANDTSTETNLGPIGVFIALDLTNEDTTDENVYIIDNNVFSNKPAEQAYINILSHCRYYLINNIDMLGTAYVAPGRTAVGYKTPNFITI